MYRLSNLFMLRMGHKAVRVLLRQESWATYAWWLPHHRIKSFIFLLVKLFSFVHLSIYLPLLSHSFLSFLIMPFMGMDVKEHIQFEFKWSNLVVTNTSKHSYIKKISLRSKYEEPCSVYSLKQSYKNKCTSIPLLIQI